MLWSGNSYFTSLGFMSRSISAKSCCCSNRLCSCCCTSLIIISLFRWVCAFGANGFGCGCGLFILSQLFFVICAYISVVLLKTSCILRSLCRTPFRCDACQDDSLYVSFVAAQRLTELYTVGDCGLHSCRTLMLLLRAANFVVRKETTIDICFLLCQCLLQFQYLPFI